MNKTENTPRPEGYSQVCVWPGTTIEPGQEVEVEEYILAETGCKVKFLETIITKPDIKNGHPVYGTGNRHDIFLAVQEDDIFKFALTRMQFGIRWVEDVIGEWNGYNDNPIYPARVSEYKTW